MASILLKGAMAIFECASGLVLFVISTQTIQYWITLFARGELVDDPNGIVAMHLMDFVQHFSSSSRIFLGTYFLAHGAVKLAIVSGLLSGRLWSFPVGLVAMAFFVIYQLHRYTYTHAFALILISVFDVFIMLLIWREYQTARLQVTIKDRR